MKKAPETLLPVLLGSDQNAYGMARSFHMAYGISSVCLARRALPATQNSAIVSCAAPEPALEEDGVFVRTLCDFAEKTPGCTRILVPCSDHYARLAARHAAALEGAYHFALPSEEVLVSLAQKETFYQICERFALPHPQTYAFDPKQEKPAPPFSFPMVAKPADSEAYWNCSFAGKRKVFFLKTQAELSDIVSRLSESDYTGKLLLQDFIPGDDSAMRVVNAYIDGAGKARLFCLGRVLLEEHTPQGIGSYAAILTGKDRELFDALMPMLQSLGYRGFLNIDMKFDARCGAYRYLELNPRQGRSSFFVTAAGANLAKVLTEDLLGLPATTPLFAEEDALWTNLPKSVLFRYVSDPALRNEAKAQIREGRFYEQLRYPPDFSLARRKNYLLNQINQTKKYRLYFLDKQSLSD